MRKEYDLTTLKVKRRGPLKGENLMGPTHPDLKGLYKTDYYTWTREIARALSERRTGDLDLENLIEEVGDLGDEKRNKFTGLLAKSFAHRIKHGWLLDRYPENEKSWQRDAVFFLRESLKVLKRNPGLKGEMPDLVEDAWETARGEVFRKFVNDFDREQDMDRMGIPETCPWTEEEILSGSIFMESEGETEIPGPGR